MKEKKNVNGETMTNVVDVYEVHHLTVEMMLKDKQCASRFEECAALIRKHRKGGKLRQCQKMESQKLKNFNI